jgi:serine/threonine protein kinase
LIGGFNPFQGETISETFHNINQLNINWPKNMNNSCRKLLSSIFVLDPEARPSITDIKNHAFFEGVYWDDLDTSFRFERIKIQR